MLIVINAVGLTPRLLQYAPRLKQIADRTAMRPMQDILPAVTMSAQATLLTGKPVNEHGIVGNGWLFRETNEIRFWQQSNRQMQSEPVYQTARNEAARRGRKFKTAKMFWWFNQGAAVDISVTPKPHYGIDGSKAFGISSTPPDLAGALETKLGKFPFAAFWGPMAGAKSSAWIAQASAEVVRTEKPDLTLVYVPHLDYDPQRFGPSGCNMQQQVQQLDDICAPLLDAAQAEGADVWVVSEYGHCDVNTVVYPNRHLREAGLLQVRSGPFGEQLETYQSKAFAVCDHQVAHVYVADHADIPLVWACLEAIPGVGKLISGNTKKEYHLNHQRAGEIIMLSQPNAWFAYPFWLDDREAPDYARCVAIHNKPGYDPCELFFDPRITLPKLKVAWKLIQKMLGFRMKLDVVPLDGTIVKGSHGLIAENPLDGPLLIANNLPAGDSPLPMTYFRDHLLQHFDLLPE
ncbi:MAG: alkaline phosphatase family protein [Zavarzinella sp.]